MKTSVTTTKENDMMYLRLHENGPEFPIGHDLLLGLARALKRRTSYPDLVTACLLYTSPFPVPASAQQIYSGDGASGPPLGIR